MLKILYAAALLTLYAALATASAIVDAASANADTPPLLHRIQPRAEWKVEKLDGYIVELKANAWNWGNADKEFSWTDSLSTQRPRRILTLVFADHATYLRAEQFQGVPVFVTAIKVTHGTQSWYLVESITEAK